MNLIGKILTISMAIFIFWQKGLHTAELPEKNIQKECPVGDFIANILPLERSESILSEAIMTSESFAKAVATVGSMARTNKCWNDLIQNDLARDSLDSLKKPEYKPKGVIIRSLLAKKNQDKGSFNTWWWTILPTLPISALANLPYEFLKKVLAALVENDQSLLSNKDSRGFTIINKVQNKKPFIFAILDELAKEKQTLIEYKKPTNDQQKFLDAAYFNQFDALKKLALQQNVDINGKDDRYFNNTALLYASFNGNTSMVEWLLSKGALVNEKDEEGTTALIWAAINGHTDIVNMLLSKGASINEKDIHGQTALMKSAFNGHANVAAMLLGQGASVNEKDAGGKIALMSAAFRGYTDIVAILLKHGASINEKDINDQTALMFAAFNGYADIVAMLLKHGALVNEKDINGKTALIWAADKGHAEIVAMLLKHGASINEKDADNKTALMWAAFTDHANIVDILLSKGASVNEKDAGGRTALMWAALKGHKSIVMILLKHDALVNEKDINDQTALMFAAFNGHADIVAMLLKHGALVNEKEKRGNKTALDIVNDQLTKVQDPLQQKKLHEVKKLLENAQEKTKEVKRFKGEKE